ncbi:DUF5780 domain-containing protein [Clostridium beijerinckii]|uniref:DUF5780 domain-containing protein n=1 Tax=Clostridium beijerinckii TaxID=1520 RepID=A0A1S8RZ97_CLOBE|nr:DUF5780 domain-containing protein [Clostridium beijerinckii]NRY61530.1 tetratricopeptide (TPR) repeat protein [Clostridium beijerinckii]OOM58469.1 hypothetical protein CLBCK_40470 [Clostridium beijerinckii]
MKCKKCGHENCDSAQFCNSCATKLNKNERHYIQNLKDKIKGFYKRKKHIILGSSIPIIIIIIGIIFFSNPMLKFEKAIKSNDIVKATSIYNESIKDNKKMQDKAIAFVKDEVSNIEKDFKNENMAYDKANNELDNIKSIGIIPLEINDSMQKIDKLNNSRTAFNKAEDYLKEGDYLNAIKQYALVIKDDKNFDNSQKKIKDNTGKYKEQVLKSAKESVSNNDYDKAVSILSGVDTIIKTDDDIISKLSDYRKKLEEKKAQEKNQKMDELKRKQEIEVISTSTAPIVIGGNGTYAKVIVKNNTNKVVKKYNVGILMYDTNGHPVGPETVIGTGSVNNLFEGKSDLLNIQPGQLEGEKYQWTLDNNYGRVEKIIACPISAEYYDGSIWSNEYYKYWNEEYLGKQYK